MDCCCLFPKWAKGQDELLLLPPERVKMGCCCLPPDRVKLTMNNKKEANSRIKMVQESKWTKDQDGLVSFAP